MRYEYVVDLDVAAADDGGGAQGAVERHVRDWLRRTVPDVPDLAGIEGRGSRVSAEEPGGRESTVEWEAVGDDRTSALRLSLRVPQRSGDAVHVTLVTIGSAPSGVSVRIAMGPEVPDGQLAPVVPDYLRSPALVRSLVTDRSLEVRASTQPVDGRYNTVRTSAEVGVVLDALRHPHRLPVLVVSALDKPRWTFAERAARELPGLAAVVALGSWEAWQRFDEGGRDTRVPEGGARLVWGLDVEHQPSYPSEQVLHHPVELVATLLEILGRASVASRSRDRAWLAAQTAGRRAAVARSAAAGEAARAAGDERARIEALTGERDQWQALAEEVDRERADSEEDLTSRLAEATARLLQAETRNQWLVSENARLKDGASTLVVDWSQAPDLDRRDAGPLYAFLTKSSSGAIAFHDAALRSWTKSG